MFCQIFYKKKSHKLDLFFYKRSFKRPFTFTKRGQIPNLIIGKVFSSKKMVGFIYQISHQMSCSSWKKIRNFGVFLPPPAHTNQKESKSLTSSLRAPPGDGLNPGGFLSELVSVFLA